MHFEVFKKISCRACGRPSEEMGYCPWCGAGIDTTRSTRFRIAVVALAAGLLLCNKAIPDSPAALLLAALLSAVVFAASSPNPNSLLGMAAAAVAGSILCHAFPETIIHTGLRLRQHAVWLLPAASLIFACSGGATLPPVPAETPWGRLWQALRAPAAVIVLALLAATAAWLPLSPATSLVMALCYFAMFHSTKLHPALPLVSVFIFVLAFLGSGKTMPHSIRPNTIFAVSLAGLGLAQGCIGMKRTGSEQSTHP